MRPSITRIIILLLSLAVYSDGFAWRQGKETVPVVNAISASSGPLAGGANIVITGSGFSMVTGVKFGSTTVTYYTVTNTTSISATVPSGTAGTVDITVTNTLGTSSTSSADQYTYVAAPTISSISPSTGSTAGGTSVSITGTNLTGASAVKFGSNNASSYTVNSSISITATSPAGSGTVDVTATTVGGTSATSGSDQFTYSVAAPTVTLVSPNSGPTAGGTSVSITGTNFSSVSNVKFGSTSAASYTVNSTTSITATSPAGTGAVDITVVAAAGTSATGSPDQFTYTTGFVINVTYDTASNTVACQANGAVPFESDVNSAITAMEAEVNTSMTLNLQIGCDSIDNFNDLSFAGGATSQGIFDCCLYSYSQIYGFMYGRTNSLASDNGYFTTFLSAASWSAAGYPTNNLNLYRAQSKLLGQTTPANDSTLDCYIGYSSSIPVGLGVGAMLHEISECMGRTGYNFPAALASFTSAGNWYPTGAVTTAHYFSTDGGTTNIVNFNTTSPYDFLDYNNSGPQDVFNANLSPGTTQSLSTIDKRNLDILGYNVN